MHSDLIYFITVVLEGMLVDGEMGVNPDYCIPSSRIRPRLKGIKKYEPSYFVNVRTGEVGIWSNNTWQKLHLREFDLEVPVWLKKYW